MSKAKLKRLRTQFRNDVFQRDSNKCVVCSAPAVDAHHITNRNDMPNGGYAKENGISLCALDHIKAEGWLNGERWMGEKYSPESLYVAIDSSYDDALKKSESLVD